MARTARLKSISLLMARSPNTFLATHGSLSDLTQSRQMARFRIVGITRTGSLCVSGKSQVMARSTQLHFRLNDSLAYNEFSSVLAHFSSYGSLFKLAYAAFRRPWLDRTLWRSPVTAIDYALGSLYLRILDNGSIWYGAVNPRCPARS